MGVNMSIPAAYDECLSQTEQLEWLYKHKENLLTAGANIKITRSGDTVVISAEGEGFSPTVSVETIPGGHRVTITDGEGPHVFDVMDGAPGQDGTDGTDGTSVTFATSSISGGTRVTLTDGDHSSHFDVMDGLDGEDITITDVSVISAGTQITFSDDTVIVIPNGLTGPTGPSGQNGRNVFIKYADAQPTQDSDMKDIPSAFMGVYSGTATTAPTTFTDYLWYQIKGAKGDTGNTGATGQDGVSPAVTIGVISGGHSVTITDAEHPSGQTFNVMDGENAAAATVTVGSTTTGQPGTNASVTNSGTSSDAVLDFVIPRGNPGPAAYVWTTDDDYTTPNYTFNISDLDGVSGETPKVGDIIFQNVNHRTFLFKINTVDTTTVLTDYFCEITGATGAAGQDGTDGVTPEISATATADATSSANPTVTVTKSGTDAQPSFAFAFSGLKGAAGTTGQGVPAGGSGNQVLAKVNATDYNTQWKTIEEVPSGGNNGDVLTQSAGGPVWAAPTGGGSGAAGGLITNATTSVKLMLGGVVNKTITSDFGQLPKIYAMPIDGAQTQVGVCGGLALDKSLFGTSTVYFNRILIEIGDGTNPITYQVGNETKTLPDGDNLDDTLSTSVLTSAPFGTVGKAIVRAINRSGTTPVPALEYATYSIQVVGKKIILDIRLGGTLIASGRASTTLALVEASFNYTGEVIPEDEYADVTGLFDFSGKAESYSSNLGFYSYAQKVSYAYLSDSAYYPYVYAKPVYINGSEYTMIKLAGKFGITTTSAANGINFYRFNLNAAQGNTLTYNYRGKDHTIGTNVLLDTSGYSINNSTSDQSTGLVVAGAACGIEKITNGICIKLGSGMANQAVQLQPGTYYIWF